MYKLFFQIILLHSFVFSHQFFLTTTEVRLSDNQKSLEITIQTFTHDVEALLKKDRSKNKGSNSNGTSISDNSLRVFNTHSAAAITSTATSTLT